MYLAILKVIFEEVMLKAKGIHSFTLGISKPALGDLFSFSKGIFILSSPDSPQTAQQKMCFFLAFRGTGSLIQLTYLQQQLVRNIRFF